MIPLRLRISGFLSYRDPVELDFTLFDLACISGQNGAGKSSLLDAMTWALFGQARKRDDSLVNLQSRAAEVALTFEYERNVYRVQRSLPRGKPSSLEFQVLQTAAVPAMSGAGSDLASGTAENWVPLTEHSLRETQERIEKILRLDYETFVNASFFLQGKADQFTQQSPGKRKDVLSNILGMELWDTYKTRTADQRRGLEVDLAATEGRLGEIAAELGEELPRRQRLAELESDLGRLAAARKSQEGALQSLRQAQAALDRQRHVIQTLESGVGESRLQLAGLQDRLADREAMRAAHAQLTQRAPEIKSAHQAWKETSRRLEEWDRSAASFHEHERERLPLVEQISAEQARLQAERDQLSAQQQKMAGQAAVMQTLESDLRAARDLLAQAESRVTERSRLQLEHSRAQESITRLRAENDAMRPEMDRLKARIDTLKAATGAACPLCGQPLSQEHRQRTLEALEAEGKQSGDRYRSNKSAADQLEPVRDELATQLADLASADEERLKHFESVTQIYERLDALRSLQQDWEGRGARRFAELTGLLERGQYAFEARAQLAKLDQQLLQLGYDAAAHDATRRQELEQRAADEEYRRLEAAQAALAPLEDEIQNVTAQMAKLNTQIKTQETDLAQARAAFDSSSAGLPPIDEAERALFALQEQENVLNQQVGAARQRVAVLEDLRGRSADLADTRQSLALSISRLKVLERAFGRDGVPALLIEQALPEIESKANDILDRLSDGQMSVRFVTLAGYKDKKRPDQKETLDIQISDGAGPRDYELYSGGEAFRVDFAIRLALSQVLAGRKGARLQTLVIDEGFASQDGQGRQRLIEAINLVRSEFAKILLITHLDELKDAFPTRIEVEKTDRGSVLHVTSA